MKIKAFNYILLVVVFLGFNAYSQKFTSNEVTSKIIKSWAVSENIIEGKAYKSENNETMNFKPDGLLIMKKSSKMMGDMTMEAKWTYNPERQKLILTLEMGEKKETVELNIKELSNSKLILSSPKKETIYIPIKPKD